MRFLTTLLAATALMATPALADHGHDKKKDKAEAAHDHMKKMPEKAQEKAQEKAHGQHGDAMKVKADDHAAHGEVDHGQDQHAGHSMNSKTMPADGAVLHHAPQKISMKFDHPMAIDSVMITTLSGDMMSLDVSGIGKTDHVMIDAPDLQPDDYTVDWRAKGDDGHVMSGAFSFTIE